MTAVLANVTNNLPACYTMEGVAASERHLFAVLGATVATLLVTS